MKKCIYCGTTKASCDFPSPINGTQWNGCFDCVHSDREVMESYNDFLMNIVLTKLENHSATIERRVLLDEIKYLRKMCNKLAELISTRSIIECGNQTRVHELIGRVRGELIEMSEGDI